MDANARLIAAAPDLLAALENVFSFVMCDDSDANRCPICGLTSSDPYTHDSENVVCQSVLAAIRKARGED